MPVDLLPNFVPARGSPSLVDYMDRLIFLERVHAYAPLPPAATDALSAALDRRTVPEGRGFANGTLPSERRLVMIASGIARVHVETDDGRDVTQYFVRAEDFVLPNLEPTSRGPRERLAAVTDVTYVSIAYSQFEALLATYPQLSIVLAQLLRERSLRARDRAERRARREPVETYESFLQTYPGLESHVPTVHLASYLGLSPGEFMRARQKYRDRSVM